MSDLTEQRGTLKRIQWEIAKGHLRTLAAIDGSASTPWSPSGRTEGPYRFELVEAAVEEFIRDFEADGLHE
jgi:hypothetical protein